MNSEKIKSLVRHALTALGTLLVFTGINKYVPLVEYLTENLDATVHAVEVLAGVVIAVYGFLSQKNRFAKAEEAPKIGE
jgi:hypothetical protein